MPSPATSKNPRTAPVTPETVATSPGTTADDAGELEITADAASEATEITAATVALDAPEPAGGTGLAAAAEGSAGQVRSVNDTVLATAKLTGTFTLDTYETTLGTLLAAEERVGALSGLGWLEQLTRAHVSLVASLSSPAFSAARKILE